MSAQHRATAEQWEEQRRWADSNEADSSCIVELHDRVCTMDECINDIYEQLDRLKTLHESNWSRIVKLEEGPAVAEARGQGSVENTLATNAELGHLYCNSESLTAGLRAVYDLGRSHGGRHD
jgi:hypothetical protein